MSEPILKVRNLSKAFGRLVVTDDVSLDVETGERHVIIGPNGAGKTSLINQIGGQLKPTSGSIFLAGREITGLKPNEICHRGLARTFQRNNLFLNLTVVENVRLAIQAKLGTVRTLIAAVGPNSDMHCRAEQVLQAVDLTSGHDRLVRSLSYGEQRQLEIAVALAGSPQVLLLDEPTSGMSQNETSRMVDLIRALPRTTAILMIEHDMSVVFEVADRITVLYYGEVIASGPPAEIAVNARVREVYLGAHIV